LFLPGCVRIHSRILHPFLDEMDKTCAVPRAFADLPRAATARIAGANCMGIPGKSLLQPARWFIAAALTLGAGMIAWDGLRWWEVRRLEAEVRALQRQREELLSYAQRLSASRRVAQVDVVRQYTDSDQRILTDLLWRQIEADGTVGSAQAISIVGELAYFEAAVIKFDFEIPKPDALPQRTSLALFRRVFGDGQSPVSGVEVQREAPLSRPQPEASTALEQNLWEMFWQFIDDPDLAQTYGVRVAQIEAPAVPLNPDEVWEVTLDATGGLNLRKIGRREITARADENDI